MKKNRTILKKNLSLFICFILTFGTVLQTKIENVQAMALTAPTIDSNYKPTFSQIDEDTIGDAGKTVSELVGNSITSLTELIGIGIYNTTGDGTWEVNFGDGTWWNIGTVSQTKACLVRSSDHLRFVPGTNFNGTATISYRAWDRRTEPGSVGSGTDVKYDISQFGGYNAYSLGIQTASITVRAVNDPPSVLFLKSSKLLNFNGSTTNVELQNLSLKGAMTFEAWVYNRNPYAAWSRLFDFGNGSPGQNVMVGFFASTGKMFLQNYTMDNGNNNQITTAEVFPINQWVHVEVTISDTGYSNIYWNGVKKAEGQAIPVPDTQRIHSFLGRSNWGQDAYFNGVIRDVRFWNYARTTEEMNKDVNKIMNGKEEGLIGFMPMLEGSGNTLIDYTGNNIIGNIKGRDGADLAIDPWVVDENSPFTVRILANTSTESLLYDSVIVSDPDVDETNNAKMTLSISVPTGSIFIDTSNGVNVIGGSNNSAAMTISGSKDNINSALSSLKYTPIMNFYGLVEMKFDALDKGNTGLGGELENARSLYILVDPVPSHKVIYDIGAGTGTTPTQGDVQEKATFTAASGTGLTKDGYAFAGWTDNSDNLNSVKYAAGTSVTMSTGDITLYAVWIPTHKITYSLNDGTGTVPMQSDVREGLNFTAASGTGLTKDGYTFAGWTDNPDNLNSVKYTAGTSVTMSTGDINLYAVWTPIPTHKVTYSLNDGTGTAPTQSDVREGLTFTTASGIGLTKDGYTFAGWTDNPDNLNSVKYTAETPVTMSTGDITLYVVWTPIPTHKVTFNLIGGTGTAPEQSDVREGLTFIAASGTGLTKAGYTFAGWTDNPDNLNSVKYTAGTSVTMSTGDMTLYAVWTPVPTHKVTYSLNGGTGTVPEQSDVREGLTFTAASGAGLTKAGYAFAGWTDNPDNLNSVKYKAGTSVTMNTGNITLYAVWREIKVSGGVADGNTGSNVAPISAVTTVDGNGNLTVSMKESEAILVKNPDGTMKPLGNSSRVTILSENGSTIPVNGDGQISFSNLPADFNNNYNVIFDLGDGQKLVIGNIKINISNTGAVSIVSSLIDPYGIITDSVTGHKIKGAKVALYYADTARNRANGKTPNTLVGLPTIEGFEPNNNLNAQFSDANGSYAFMVFPNTDYYIVSTKDGYDNYKSPTISVDKEIVKFDFRMTPTRLPQTGSVIGQNSLIFGGVALIIAGLIMVRRRKKPKY